MQSVVVEIMNSQQESDQLRIVDLESGGETKIKEERNDELETVESLSCETSNLLER